MAYKSYMVTSPPTWAEGVHENVKGQGGANHLFYLKYDPPKKNSEFVLPYKHVNAFLNKAQTMCIFPIEESPILRFFLKSTNLKHSTMSPNSQST